MVLGEAVAGAAAGVHALFGYNRENFLYDRKQRLENEYKILEWRATQAELWRDDLREVIGLTEKKMDTYLIVNTLQLGMCVGLFAEGRLEPGTPPWLLHFYMMTLGAAFMYLLMSVWLAMHASVVAACSSVRLLTQFVRLPVPTWAQLEEMRTYASSCEQLEAGRLLRVPFTGRRGRNVDGGVDGGAVDPWGLEDHGDYRDMYELKEHPAALRRHIMLAKKAARQYQCFDAFARTAMSFGTNQLLNAIGYYVLGYAAVQDGAPVAAWCVFVILAAIALALVHLDFSLTRKEQLLAKILILSGPTFSSAATCAWVMRGVRAEATIMALLPVAYAAHGLWLFFALTACGLEAQPNGSVLPMKLRAVLYLDVFGWLFKGPSQRQGQKTPVEGHAGRNPYVAVPQEASPASPSQRVQLEALRADAAMLQSDRVRSVMTEAERARVEKLVQRVSAAEAAVGSGQAAEAGAGRRLVKLHAHTDCGKEVPYLFNPDTGEVSVYHEGDYIDGDPAFLNERSLTAIEERVEQYCSDPGHGEGPQVAAHSSGMLEQTVQAARESVMPVVESFDVIGEQGLCGGPTPASRVSSSRHPGQPRGTSYDGFTPSGEHAVAPDHVFHPLSYAGGDAKAVEEEADVEIVTGHDMVHPGRLPAKVFRLATMLLILLWALGLALPFGVFRDFMTKPLTADIFVEDIRSSSGQTKEVKEMELEPVEVDTDRDPDADPEAVKRRPTNRTKLPALPRGQLINVEWPSHSGFVPRSLSCDHSGTQLVVADDLGVYAGQLSRLFAQGSVPSVRGGERGETAAVVGRRLGEVPVPLYALAFERVPPCTALEGQALKDIGVVCTEASQGEVCRVVVLHARGRRLAECPLPPVRSTGTATPAPPAQPVQPMFTWTISSDWLQSGRKHDEYVESIAVANECLHKEQPADGSSDISEDAGCIVVGTTSGRIVQLRGAFNDQRRLVPQRAMQQRERAVGRGSLHVFPNGFVMALRRDSGSVQAFDSQLGRTVGEWRLPAGVHWLTLCGGGDSLFVLGLRGRSRTELHRFPVPNELKARPMPAEPLQHLQLPRSEEI